MINANIIKEELENDRWDNRLLEIYRDFGMIKYEKERYIKAVNTFEYFFKKSEIEIYSAPGRTEVCGNHTDHQNGQVLAAAINRDIIAVVAQNNGFVRIKSGDNELIEIELKDIHEISYKEGTSLALVVGMIIEFQNNGYDVKGFDAYIDSDVPEGAGLSSSAAFEVLVGTVISGMYNDMRVCPINMAFIARKVENDYFGKPCGLMDQLACSVGDFIHINFLNDKSPQISKIGFELEREGYCICVVDTGASHSDLTEEYTAIREEMTAVAHCVGKSRLSDITLDVIMSNTENIRNSCGDRAFLRSVHYVRENDRVKRAVDAIEKDDMREYLKIIKESGESSYKYLQNLYSPNDFMHQSLPIAVVLSEYLLGEDEISRVHGGGFAGTIQSYVKKENVKLYSEYMNGYFGKEACKILSIRKYGGIKVFTD